MASAGTTRTASIIDAEAEHFGALAKDWWDPKGSSAMLHRLNPVRLGYIREAIDRHFETNARARKPLAGKRVLDVGCGAGLLCEPLARLGGQVTGLDAAAENIAVARDHAALSGLEIDYKHQPVEELGEDGFDLVTSLEVIEHVADPASFAASLASKLAPGGLMIVSTPNRTPLSKLLLVDGAELAGMIPRGTHDWDKFLTPEQLETLFADQGLVMDHMQGIAFSPDKGLHISSNITLNYIACLQWSE